MRFVAVGAVDDGKSTLIGRLLYDSKLFFDDQVAAADLESRKYGTQGDTLDLAAGTYNEPGLVIDKALTIQGQGVVVQ